MCRFFQLIDCFNYKKLFKSQICSLFTGGRRRKATNPHVWGARIKTFRQDKWLKWSISWLRHTQHCLLKMKKRTYRRIKLCSAPWRPCPMMLTLDDTALAERFIRMKPWFWVTEVSPTAAGPDMAVLFTHRGFMAIMLSPASPRKSFCSPPSLSSPFMRDAV